MPSRQEWDELIRSPMTAEQLVLDARRARLRFVHDAAQLPATTSPGCVPHSRTAKIHPARGAAGGSVERAGGRPRSRAARPCGLPALAARRRPARRVGPDGRRAGQDGTGSGCSLSHCIAYGISRPQVLKLCPPWSSSSSSADMRRPHGAAISRRVP